MGAVTPSPTEKGLEPEGQVVPVEVGMEPPPGVKTPTTLPLSTHSTMMGMPTRLSTVTGVEPAGQVVGVGDPEADVEVEVEVPVVEEEEPVVEDEEPVVEDEEPEVDEELEDVVVVDPLEVGPVDVGGGGVAEGLPDPVEVKVQDS
jgi:hypothetical protein